jgi:hypothetical protein
MHRQAIAGGVAPMVVSPAANRHPFCKGLGLMMAITSKTEWVECRHTSCRCQQEYRVLLWNILRRTYALMRLYANLGPAGDCT